MAFNMAFHFHVMADVDDEEMGDDAWSIVSKLPGAFEVPSQVIAGVPSLEVEGLNSGSQPCAAMLESDLDMNPNSVHQQAGIACRFEPHPC